MDEPRRLYRSETDRMLAGVCGGLGEFFGVDPTVIRVLFVLLSLAGGTGIVLYLAMWFVVPTASRVGGPPVDHTRHAFEEVRDTVQRGADRARGTYERWRADGAGAETVPPAPGAQSPGERVPPDPAQSEQPVSETPETDEEPPTFEPGEQR